MNRRSVLKSLAAFPLVGWMFGSSARAVEVVPDASWTVPPVIHDEPQWVVHWASDQIINVSWENRIVLVGDSFESVTLCFAEHKNGQMRLIHGTPHSHIAHSHIRVTVLKSEVDDDAVRAYRSYGMAVKDLIPLWCAIISSRMPLQWVNDSGVTVNFKRML